MIAGPRQMLVRVLVRAHARRLRRPTTPPAKPRWPGLLPKQGAGTETRASRCNNCSRSKESRKSKRNECSVSNARYNSASRRRTTQLGLGHRSEPRLRQKDNRLKAEVKVEERSLN